jgi:2-phosphosulfolactate phosphatase
VTPAPRADPFGQSSATLRLDWGVRGADATARDADVAVVVDVLSFTTTLSVAADRGITVLPFRWRDERAVAYAREHDAVLAVPRRDSVPGAITLSPSSVRATSDVERLVLPSPNGSTICAHLREHGVTVVGASLRNARAVAGWVAGWVDAHHDLMTGRVAVVAAGERWPDGSLRPAVEDLWGAGAVLAVLAQVSGARPAPEAVAAIAAYRAVEGHEPDALAACASGVELAGDGFADDVAVAGEVDSSAAVPVLVGPGFVDASRLAEHPPWRRPRH